MVNEFQIDEQFSARKEANQKRKLLPAPQKPPVTLPDIQPYGDDEDVSDEDKKNATVLSMDVKSLYPSITKAVAKKAIEDILLNTDLAILNINWWEAVKFVFVTVSK